MITNRELMERYDNLNGTKEVKVEKLKEIYNAIVANEHTNIMNEMAEKFNISVWEWKVYRAISLRVINNTLEVEGLS